MDIFQSVKDDLQQLNQEMASFLTQTRQLEGLWDSGMDEWERICSGIASQMAEDVIRVAVVGPIKSGKSTFVNSLFKADYLKRGAGVVTSIVTRIRRGPYLKASLYFKSWDEVNSEIEQALTLFPGRDARFDTERFDIRREKDRTSLEQGLQSLNSDLLVTNGARNINGVLLESYLSGYETVKEVLASERVTRAYEDDLFDAHKSFAGSDSLAVYLKDIQLEINAPDLDSNVEIADCQGSDSPNPLHLAMIQNYLAKTHFIIYVISSRTGLRQADMRFLSMIKQMGIIDNILFVVNCDFSEHESMDDMMTLADKVRFELSLIKPDPPMYTLSSLYNLFRSSDKAMTEKDVMRLSQWESETDMVRLSNEDTMRFHRDLHDKLTRERYTLLLKNNIERMGLIAAGLENWSRIHKDLFNRDARSVADVLKKIEYHQRQMDQIRTLVKSTLDGSSGKIKQELKQAVDRFFDPRYGKVLQNVRAYIRNFQIDFSLYEENLAAASFTDTLYLIFQDFKAALDGYMAETVNPQIIHFIQEEEAKVRVHLASVGEPYESMIAEAIAEYRRSMGGLGITLLENQGLERAMEHFKSGGRRGELNLPPIETTMRYSARIKTEAVVRLGFHSMATLFRRLLRKETADQDRRKVSALKDSIKRMKRETERSVALHFKDYQENIKFQYMFKLTDIMSHQVYELLLEQFQSYATNVSKTIERVKERHSDKQATREMLAHVEARSTSFTERIQDVRARMESFFETIADAETDNREKEV